MPQFPGRGPGAHLGPRVARPVLVFLAAPLGSAQGTCSPAESWGLPGPRGGRPVLPGGGRRGGCEQHSGQGEGQAGRRVPGVPARQAGSTGLEFWVGRGAGRGEGRVLRQPVGPGRGGCPVIHHPHHPPSSRPARPAQREQNAGWESPGGRGRPRSTPGLAPRRPGPAALDSSGPALGFQSELCSPSACSLPGAPIFQGAAGGVHGHSPPRVWRTGVHGLRHGSFSRGACPGHESGLRAPVSCPRPWLGATPWALCTVWAVARARTRHRSPVSNHPGGRPPSVQPSAPSTICKPFTSSLQVGSSSAT